MKTCKQCGKDLIGKQCLFCKKCLEKDKDLAKKVVGFGGLVVAVLGIVAKVGKPSKDSSS